MCILVIGDKDPDNFIHTLLTLLMLSSVLCCTPHAKISDGEEQLFCFPWTKICMLPDS